MRIGIDATAIPAHRVGAGNYIFNLIRGLAQVDRKNQYVIFSKPEHIEEWKIDQPNFKFISSASRWRPMRLLWEQIILPGLIRRHKIEVFHSPHYTLPILARCRTVVTFCDMIFFLYPELHSRAKRVFFANMMRISARCADALITISNSTANDLLRILHVQADKIHSIHLAADEQFRPIADVNVGERICRKYGLSRGKYILYVGLLEPRKNIPTLLHAYRHLLDSGVKENLVIVGRKGWMYREIFAELQALKLDDKVIFTGYVPDHELPALYGCAHVFVYPSVYEGFGLPVLEAMACGAAVVTTNVSSMPEIVGDAGILIDPRDAGQLADGVKKVISDDHLCRSLQQRGLKRAADFSWGNTALATLRVYKQVCGGKP